MLFLSREANKSQVVFLCKMVDKHGGVPISFKLYESHFLYDID